LRPTPAIGAVCTKQGMSAGLAVALTTPKAHLPARWSGVCEVARSLLPGQDSEAPCRSMQRQSGICGQPLRADGARNPPAQHVGLNGIPQLHGCMKPCGSSIISCTCAGLSTSSSQPFRAACSLTLAFPNRTAAADASCSSELMGQHQRSHAVHRWTIQWLRRAVHQPDGRMQYAACCAGSALHSGHLLQVQPMLLQLRPRCAAAPLMGV